MSQKLINLNLGYKMQLINSKEYGGHFLVSILFFSFYLIKDNFVEKFKTDKNKFEGLNNITPIISINDNSIRPAIHRPLFLLF